MKYIIISILLLLIGAQKLYQLSLYDGDKSEMLGSADKLEMYRSWKKQYKNSVLLERSENNFQDDFRFQVFLENLAFIEKHNSEETGVVLGLNQFADLTKEEFKQIYLPKNADKAQDTNTQAQKQVRKQKELNVGLSNITVIDWSINGAVGRVQNQRQCSAGYAFASVDNAQSIHFMKTGQLEYFSQQQVIDCQKDGGCKDGEPIDSLNYIANNGLFHSVNYPYKAELQSCQQTEKSKIYKTTKPFTKAIQLSVDGGVELLQQALNKNPIVVGVSANQDSFQFYKGGIIQCESQLITHYVLLTGSVYDSNELQGYWILKNSWGKDWGEQGFFRLPYGASCGLSFQSYTGEN